eukprot:gene11844-biopygen12442
MHRVPRRDGEGPVAKKKVLGAARGTGRTARARAHPATTAHIESGRGSRGRNGSGRVPEASRMTGLEQPDVFSPRVAFCCACVFLLHECMLLVFFCTAGCPADSVCDQGHDMTMAMTDGHRHDQSRGQPTARGGTALEPAWHHHELDDGQDNDGLATKRAPRQRRRAAGVMLL